MVIVIIRATLLYVVVLISMRIMGKGEVGELQPFDLVVSLMIAEIAALPMEDLNSPMSHGITAILTLVFLQCFTSYISLKSNSFRKIVCGRPTILLAHGKFNVEEMNRVRVNVNDILTQMRLNGYTTIDEVDYMIMETNGQMSIIASAKGNSSNKGCRRLPIPVILDGKIMEENIIKFHLNKSDLDEELKRHKTTAKKVLYAMVDEKNNYVLYKRN